VINFLQPYALSSGPFDKQDVETAIRRQPERRASRAPNISDVLTIEDGKLVLKDHAALDRDTLGQPHVTCLIINRLAHNEINAMIDGITGNKLLPANVRQDIIERTDGIPLFVEEMTKAVLEAGGEKAAVRAAATIPSPVVAVPASLHTSLMARLDRLDSAKEVAQIGAAISREFSYELLSSVAQRTDAELRTALGQLVDASLAFSRGSAPASELLVQARTGAGRRLRNLAARFTLQSRDGGSGCVKLRYSALLLIIPARKV